MTPTITVRTSEQDVLIERDGMPVVIVRWPDGDREIAERYFRTLRRLEDERDTLRAEVERLTRERDEARAAREEGDSLATDHLRQLRDLAWEIAGERFTIMPSWTSGEECLQHIRAKWEHVKRERADLALASLLYSTRAKLAELLGAETPDSPALIAAAQRVVRERDKASAEADRLRALIAEMAERAHG